VGLDGVCVFSARLGGFGGGRFDRWWWGGDAVVMRGWGTRDERWEMRWEMR